MVTRSTNLLESCGEKGAEVFGFLRKPLLFQREQINSYPIDLCSIASYLLSLFRMLVLVSKPTTGGSLLERVDGGEGGEGSHLVNCDVVSKPLPLGGG